MHFEGTITIKYKMDSTNCKHSSQSWPAQHIKNSCGAEPTHNSGLNKPVVGSHAIWNFNLVDGVRRDREAPYTTMSAGKNGPSASHHGSLGEGHGP